VGTILGWLSWVVLIQVFLKRRIKLSAGWCPLEVLLGGDLLSSSFGAPGILRWCSITWCLCTEILQSQRCKMVQEIPPQSEATVPSQSFLGSDRHPSYMPLVNEPGLTQSPGTLGSFLVLPAPRHSCCKPYCKVFSLTWSKDCFCVGWGPGILIKPKFTWIFLQRWFWQLVHPSTQVFSFSLSCWKSATWRVCVRVLDTGGVVIYQCHDWCWTLATTVLALETCANKLTLSFCCLLNHVFSVKPACAGSQWLLGVDR
jgi:hypothetical protein